MASETRPLDGALNAGAAGLLLTPDDPPPARFVNPGGRSRFLLIGDHAGNRIPARLGTLGLGAAERRRHIGWDIGIAALGEALAEALDAVFVMQRYSRLVIDCNREPTAADAIPAVSDGTAIPANQRLDANHRAAREAAIHAPYHAAIAAELERRDARGETTAVVALHSFTPALRAASTGPRPWQIGILHDCGDPAFALACLAALRARDTLTVGDNAPYRMDGIDHSVPRHCYPARRPYVEIEIRQDLLAAADGPATWATIVATMLADASR